MEILTIKDGTYRGPRSPMPQDFEGTLDTLFVNDEGMKVAQVLNAKGGIVIGTYDKNNDLTELFLPADLLIETFAKPPEKKAEAKAEKAEEEKARAKLQTEAEKEKVDADADEPPKRSHHKKADK